MQRYLFVLPDVTVPVGGVNVAIQMVEILQSNGIEAYVVHASRYYKYSFFASETTTLYYPPLGKVPLRFMGRRRKIKESLRNFIDDVKPQATKNTRLDLNSRDVIVIPEFWYPEYSDIFPNNRKILLAQDVYGFLRALSRDKANDKSILDQFEGIITTSQASYEAVKKFSNRDSYLISQAVYRKSLDAQAPKKKQILYMPRKRPEDISLLVSCMKDKEDFADWTFKAIQNVSTEELDSLFSESLIFLSFSYQEGFGLPPAEAMAAGCIVIGYTGVGGEEYFNAGCGITVPDGDISAFADSLTSVVREYEVNPERLDKLRYHSSNFIHGRYNLELMRKSLISTWKYFGET